MNYKIAYKILLFGMLFLVCACESLQKYPDEPQISFTSLTITEDNDDFKTVLEFHLIDGDGDIGIVNPEQDSTTQNDSLRYFDFFSDYYYKEDGIYNKVKLKLNYYFFMPKIVKEGQDKSVIADVYVDMALTKSVFHYDTFKLDFYIQDRALNKSNVETITDFVLKEGVITSKTPE